MAQVCVSQNFDISTGALGVQPWSVPRHVFDQTYASVGNGPFGSQTSLPGKLMIDSGVQAWTNTAPLPANVLFRLHRGSRYFTTSSPNVVQIRDRYTTSIGDIPRVPNTAGQYQGASGGGMDRSTNVVGTPFPGQIQAWEDASITEDWLGPVPAGETLYFHYRAYLWTPPPWSNNANYAQPFHEATVDPVRIQLMAFPTQDQGVMS